MECNVGGSDRALRTGLGIGAIALAIAASRYCPLNAVIGLNTCRQESD